MLVLSETKKNTLREEYSLNRKTEICLWHFGVQVRNRHSFDWGNLHFVRLKQY